MKSNKYIPITKVFIYNPNNYCKMKQFKLVIAMVLLISSIVVFAINMLNSQAIQIVLETGQEVTTSSNYFTLTKVIIIAMTSFFIGGAITYVFYNSDKDNNVFKMNNEKNSYDLVIPFLKDDEKKVILSLKDNKGEILQNKLVRNLGISKVKTTRLLASLERKNLIVKERFGLTNKIRFIK